MKNLKDVLFITQARLESQRVPRKMLRPFCGTTLLDILIKKIKRSKIIPVDNYYLSVCDDELADVGTKYGVKCFRRSRESALAETDLAKIFEWHNKLPFKYVVLISACHVLSKIETIDSFVESFLKSEKEGLFAVFKKKTYYWDKNKKSITNYGGLKMMNTKLVEPVYEAAHCLYASPMDQIKDGIFPLGCPGPPEAELFVMNELEAFDIDYEWQFKTAQTLYMTLPSIDKKILSI